METQLSIIIPVLNDAAALHRLLPYLLEHGDAMEIWVIEAPLSEESSATICDQYNVNYSIAPSCGRAVQMNYGARLARANTLLFVHADVLPPPTFAKRIQEKISTGFAFGYFAYTFSPTNKLLDFNASFTGKDGLYSGGGDQCHFMTKAAFDRLGGYDESYVIMEDFALVKKAKQSKLPLSIVQDRALVSSRKYQNNSYVRVNLTNLLVLIAFHLGAKPQLLKKIYRKAIH